jgi:hypothetical protein
VLPKLYGQIALARNIELEAKNKPPRDHRGAAFV